MHLGSGRLLPSSASQSMLDPTQFDTFLQNQLNAIHDQLENLHDQMRTSQAQTKYLFERVESMKTS